MKITLLAIGKTNARFLQEGIDQYTKRLSHYIPFELKIFQFFIKNFVILEKKYFFNGGIFFYYN